MREPVGKTERPDPDAVMRQLKDFQKRTVEYVFRRMYVDGEPTLRFLVADEAGLGKTMVARGVIARAVDLLWNTVPRIDVLYICSNADIARQNISRLNISVEENSSLASRMTLLPLTIEDLQESKLNFVAFTPGTSFNLRSSEGIREERILLYHLLRQKWGFEWRAGPMKVFQGGVEDFYGWREELRSFDTSRIDASLKAAFLDHLDQEEAVSTSGVSKLREGVAELADFLAYRSTGPGYLSSGTRSKRRDLVGGLRFQLSRVCLNALEPDLIILDEFQRFKHLLDGTDQMSALAQELFSFRDPDGNKARVLLLSATPYKMYTRHFEAEDHFSDFIDTVKFLQDDEMATARFKKRLERHREALYSAGSDAFDNLRQSKEKVEESLQQIMTRTERLRVGSGTDAMVRSASGERLEPRPSDFRAFRSVDLLAEELHAHDHLEYWKSAAYLPNFMDDYVLKRRLKDRIEATGGVELGKKIGRLEDQLLSWKTIEKYESVDPQNAKLRSFLKENLEGGRWKLLWLPPSLPYYESEGVFSKWSGREVTKSLVFSNWQVVPKVISTLVSFEAERSMVRLLDSESGYSELRLKRRPLLRFASQAGRLTGMPVLSHLYPCVMLSQEADPLLMDSADFLTVSSVLDTATSRIAARLEDILPSEGNLQFGPADERWYWAAISFLDRAIYREAMESWLDSPETGDRWESMVRGGDEADTLFASHVEEFRKSRGELELGRVPDDLARVLAKVALGSPAVCALRALLRVREVENAEDLAVAMASAAKIGMAFRSLFNLPESICLIRGIDDREPYWQRVLEYCVEGNLQACLDEYVHILTEWLGLIDADSQTVFLELAGEISKAVSIRTVRLEFDEFDVDLETDSLELNRRALRSRFAMRFGEGKNDEGDEVTREDQVRSAFNSPFAPFVLATTSVGQEGLDFHLYCHCVYHWDLPSNPVDLEQREGRVHRYKGHAIRKNVAKAFGLRGFEEVRRNGISDIWKAMFELARNREEKETGTSELDPYWIFEVDDGALIERRIPIFPLSRDAQFLKELQASLAAYRLAFGQPRQEDLVAFLLRHFGSSENLKELVELLRMDLSPPHSQ